jgi:hypothetical protein
VSRARHHSSHRRLIEETAGADHAPVDAIIVPSARRPASLHEAGRLAEELDAVLLVLCSRHSDAASVVEALSVRPNLRFTAIDFPAAGVARMPVLDTSTVLGESRLKRRTDTSAKRNLGLALARMAAWRRVVFLDDDITVPDATDLTRAAALLDTRDGVGLNIGGFPDNSVVCHANRETGATQETFIGGGALAVPADRIDSFFPEIYNEDWFFLLDKTMLRPVGQVGEARQREYDPFANPDRARSEEFGDVLAEGLFSLFDDGGKIGDANWAYWKAFLEARRAFIDEIKMRIESPSQGSITLRHKNMLESLTAAKGRLRFIQPVHCVQYIEAWQRDRVRWRAFMNGIRPMRPTEAPIEVAARRFGLEPLNRLSRVVPATTPQPRVPAALG